MDDGEARRLAAEVMEAAVLAMVTTVGADGFPMTRAMFNLRRREEFPGLAPFFANEAEPFTAYFATNTSLPKVAQMRRDPRACLYYFLPDSFRGLTLKGRFEILGDSAVKEAIWQEGWELYYPSGPGDPDYTVFRMVPFAAHYYHQLQFARFALSGAAA